MGRTGTTRRHALIAVGGGLLTACSSEGPDPAAVKKAEDTGRLRAARDSRALLGEYDAVLERHPDLAAALTPLRTAVAAHVRALAPADGPAPSTSASPSGSPPSPSPSATAAGTLALADDPADAVKALAAAERRTAAAHSAALLDAPPELARLLASLAAAGATHVYLLTKGSVS
ncbi:hypothetical protein [Streptomyces liangshanensis]|uniref:Lipoprotein n=1 Tax=Streptomyces liangshanensis TaxID=2717324 RepID=A0A6G9GVZ5_9ACTN|nr:hypothetical protein [Streptomyces liangshanensis]QIQ02385.1 hypothetical protein HA039_08745 [Streptomyces liangshanensis]